MTDAELSYGLQHLQEVDDIPQLLEMLVSFDFSGDANTVELQRYWCTQVANRLIALAARDAAALVMAKLGPLLKRV